MKKKKQKKKSNKKNKKQKETPNWQPLSMMPTIASLIDGEVEGFEDLYGNLLEAKDKPGVMDDYTIERVLDNHRHYLEDAWVYDEQVKRWSKQKLTEEQSQEVNRLTEQMKKYREMCQKIIEVTEKMEGSTINKIMEMSEEELALAILSGELKMPGME